MLMEFSYRFEAAHRFLNSESIPCMTPHGHTWVATLGIEFLKPYLDQSQMTIEFSKVKQPWKELIQETFDHSYMHNINDPVVEVLKTSQGQARLMPFPGDPTTELISLFMFEKMEQVMKQTSFKDDIQISFIKLQETPTNSIVCNRNFYEQMKGQHQKFSGWWQNSELKDRSIRIND